MKRETEEIEKLTQRSYSRRQITSNWERYTIPEVVCRPEEEDEFAAADFASLLQVPMSCKLFLLNTFNIRSLEPILLQKNFVS